MNKQLLIISTSPHKGGNSDTLAEEFAKGAFIILFGSTFTFVFTE